MKASSFTRSLGKMPKLENEYERKLWEDSAESPKVRRVLIARLRALAENGCVWAQKEYALCYQTGDCVQQSSSEALKWYLEAAKQGDATAAVIVACWYRDGKSVEKNESEMVSWLKEASKYGDADAEFLLAQCYEAGRGVSKDVKVALELYRSAATRGHVKACSLLGIRFTTEGCPSDGHLGDVADPGIQRFVETGTASVRLRRSVGDGDDLTVEFRERDVVGDLCVAEA